MMVSTRIKDEQLTDILFDVEEEIRSARRQHAPMHSAHEGYAVLKEEVEELWDEIKLKQPSILNLRTEAIQVAAMAVLFVKEVIEGEHDE